ncbi:MAG: 3-keto-5-aminohexanoate cleavage protein [Thermoplasmatota archaeon]
MSSDLIQERHELFGSKPDMVSIILNHHDEYFSGIEVNRLHTRKELENYCKLCREKKIKPEFEVWHYGSIWNLNFLIGKKLVEKPYFLTQFLGWPGGTWSPPTKDELEHRIKYLPAECVCSVSVMGPDQEIVLTRAIELNKHVRVGTEDYPYLKKGVLAKDNAELVKKIVKLSKEKGREISDLSFLILSMETPSLFASISTSPKSIGVSTEPGLILLTLIPRGASSHARARVNAIIAPFVPPYIAWFICPT